MNRISELHPQFTMMTSIHSLFSLLLFQTLSISSMDILPFRKDNIFEAQPRPVQLPSL